ncbi:MAG: tripartite tricarboxylate transporter TctB family protein [Polaromonas sp.]|nr:tripartite tricarboxylate transporter TctB family protein [Polaromonas sp.]
MEPNQESGAESRTGVATYVIEAIVATCVVIMGAVVLQGSWALGSGWTTDGPGPGYFPFYIGIILCVSGLGVLLQTLLSKDKNREVFVDSEQLKRVLSVLLPAVVYVLAIQFVGLYVSSAVYIALFMIILGKFSPIKSVITSLIVVVLFFFMFEVWFRVPLFKGQFDPLSFLGY